MNDKVEHARLTATVMVDPMRGGMRRVDSPHGYIELNRAEPSGGTKFVANVECSTDLPSDALGELAALAFQCAWGAGFDPVADNIVIVISCEVVDGPLNGESVAGMPSALTGEEATDFLIEDSASGNTFGAVKQIDFMQCIEGPGNWIIGYSTDGDCRVACVGRNNRTDDLEVKWDEPA